MSIAADTFVIQYDGTTVAEGGDYTVLPAGTKVLANVMPTSKEGTTIEKRPFAKTGPNAQTIAQAVRFRIADGQKGAGRNVFANIPLARQIFSQKQNKMSPAYDFFGFYRALGYDVDSPQGFALPADHELMGQEIELVLSVEDDGKGGQRNGIRFFNKANGIPAQVHGSAPAQGGAAQPPAWTPPGTAPAAQQQAPAGFQPPVAQQQAYQPPTQQAYQPPAQPQGGAAPWATPPAAPQQAAYQPPAQAGFQPPATGLQGAADASAGF